MFVGLSLLSPFLSLSHSWFILQGNTLHNCTDPARVAFGSVVTLRSEASGAGLLHSHAHLYPKGMVQQQQITTYVHKVGGSVCIFHCLSLSLSLSFLLSLTISRQDANNNWTIKAPQGDGAPTTT